MTADQVKAYAAELANVLYRVETNVAADCAEIARQHGRECRGMSVNAGMVVADQIAAAIEAKFGKGEK